MSARLTNGSLSWALSNVSALPRDTVLVGCIGNVGKLGMVGNEQSATNQQINALICNSENDPEFVYYCFHENREKLEKCAVRQPYLF